MKNELSASGVSSIVPEEKSASFGRPAAVGAMKGSINSDAQPILGPEETQVERDYIVLFEHELNNLIAGALGQLRLNLRSCRRVIPHRVR